LIEIEEAVQALSRASVRFIIVGGVAATVHGSARLTEDLDVVYDRDAENLQRLADAIRPYQPYLRGAPPGLPFRWDAETLRRGLNFTLSTTLGDLDLLGEVAGGGGYSDLLPYSTTVKLFGMECLCVRLDRLILLKRAAGRPKDTEAIAEMEAILEERERLGRKDEPPA
jgi:predicted nucleotidyltransferase